mmetsp:Transcript_9551/g.17990  ORF Transcript_9551/g.17990 Transcript_9551/m.17990 type:complete len:419 (-) Transcript_9551:569-1825(-)
MQCCPNPVKPYENVTPPRRHRKDAKYLEPSDLAKRGTVSLKHRRIMIATFFVECLGFPLERNGEWEGKHGAIYTIKKVFKLGHGFNACIRKLLRRIVKCAEAGVEYTGEVRNAGMGRPVVILPTVTPAAVTSAYMRLKPTVTRVVRRSQGSSDPDAPWSKARCAWVRQLLIRFGKMEYDGPHPIPKEFDVHLLGRLSEEQVGFWDETHKVVESGEFGSKRNVQIRFHRDKEGRLDPNGELRSAGIQMSFKYPGQTRLGLGCGIVERKLVSEDGEETLVRDGCRAKPYDYSGKTLVSIKNWTKLISGEIKRVRKLTGKNSGWIEKTRESKEEFLRKYARENARPGHALLPATINHTKETNPYFSRYGPNEWYEKIVSSSHLAHYAPITDLIHHIVTETHEMFRGSTAEHSWVFYHDALS